MHKKTFGPILSIKANKLKYHKLCVSYTAERMIQLQTVPQINSSNQLEVSLLTTHYTSVTYR